MRIRVALTVVLLAVIGTAALAQAPATAPEETKEQRDARMQWWREARFGLFIHWGLYAVPAGVWKGQPIAGIGEWIMNRGKIPVQDYGALTSQFNPVRFNADEWVSMAKNAGMKYIIITSKHHDGFAMFRSAATPYNIHDATPFHRDPLKELAEACERQGMRLGFYYSQAQDWHHPGGAASGGHWDKAQEGDMGQYLRTIAVPQVRELLTNYGHVSVLWWDTPVGMTKEYADLLRPLLKLQPGIITNNRLGGGYAGDSETPEQRIPATGLGDRDWETCMTMNDTWGFKVNDNNWKPTVTLIRNLIDIASKGGNYLLNVGPTAEGTIPQASVDRLAEIGKWMKVNGEAIYATKPSPFKKLAWGRCTQKPGKLYLHVFDWPTDGKLVVPVLNHVTKAYLLADPETALSTTAAADSVTIAVPATAPDALASVVVAEIEGEPQVAVQDTAIAQQSDGTARLRAFDAELITKSAKLEGSGEQNIGFWTDVNDLVQWQLRVDKPGRYEVEVNYSCEPGSEGSEYVVVIGDRAVVGKVAATKSWKDYQVANLGTVELTNTGKVGVMVRALRKPALAVMNLRSVALKPVAQ